MAAHPFRSIALVVLVGQGLGVLGPAGHDAGREGTLVEYTDTPAAVVDMAEWAVGLFDAAGMALPPIEFRYHGDDTDGCDGEEGLHRPDDDHHVIELCRSDRSFATQVTVLHEFAHAWATHDVDHAARAAFQDLRGYELWNDRSGTPWHERGTEQAAEIVVWGLIDRPLGISRISQNGCDDLHAGFVILTGREPLHGFRDLCD